MIVANFMDSSLLDLRKKGVFAAIAETYNPLSAYEHVLHFTPHACDLELSEALYDHHIEIRVHDVSGLEPLRFLKALVRIWVSLGRDRVDIVRGRLPYVGSLMGGLAGRLRGLPFVVSLGGDNRIPQDQDGYYYGSKMLSYALEKLVLRLADRIIVPNLFTQAYVERVIGIQAARKRCAVISWLSPPVAPFDPADDDALLQLNISRGQAILPIIGFVNRYKFSHVIFDVLKNGPLRDSSGLPALVCFAGDGPLRAEGEHRFADRDDVLFLGWQPRSIVQALLRRAHAVIIPMSGFVLLEAASLGKPVITSLAEWHSELVQDGHSGLLVDPNDPKAWRDAITRLLDVPAEAHAMGRSLKQAHEFGYSYETCAAAEHKLYEELTGKKVALSG